MAITAAYIETRPRNLVAAIPFREDFAPPKFVGAISLFFPFSPALLSFSPALLPFSPDLLSLSPDLVGGTYHRAGLRFEVRKGNVKTAMSRSPKVTQIEIGASFEGFN